MLIHQSKEKLIITGIIGKSSCNIRKWPTTGSKVVRQRHVRQPIFFIRLVVSEYERQIPVVVKGEAEPLFIPSAISVDYHFIRRRHVRLLAGLMDDLVLSTELFTMSFMKY